MVVHLIVGLVIVGSSSHVVVCRSHRCGLLNLLFDHGLGCILRRRGDVVRSSRCRDLCYGRGSVVCFV